MVATRFRLLLSGTFLCAGLACKTTEPQPVPVQLGLISAPPATAQSGVALSPQPAVQVQDASGNPVADPGRRIGAVLASQGGALSGTLEARTDAQGKATFTDLVLSGPAGQRTLRFDALGLRSASAGPITVGPGIAATLTASAGNFQTAAAGTAVALAPAVLATDASGNPVPNVPVSFTVADGGGSVVTGSSVTNASGVAALTSWTLGPVVGLNSLTVTSTAIPSASVTFTATGILGPPAILTRVTGDGQTATVGGPTPVSPSAKLTDAFGNVVAGVIVTFAPAPGSGAVTGGAATTNALGVATLGTWTLGLIPGANTLTAARAGVPSVTYQATGTDFPVSAIAAGNGYTCAVAPGGLAYCWGFNSSGQLGNGTLVGALLPTRVGGGLLFTTVSAGVSHTCGLVGDGDAWCWGENGLGQLGDGSGINRSLPVAVAGGLKFTSIALGLFHTCGLQAGGAAFCWGAGPAGRLGDGTQENRPVPTAVTGGRFFSLLSVGTSHTCGVATDGTVLCWGANGNGRLGDGTVSDRFTPTPVSSALRFIAVAAGGEFSCAIATGGAGYCWGNGGSGVLGTGNTTTQLTPTAISGGLVLTAVSSGVAHSCALVGAGQAYCWGFNSSGQVGDGTDASRPAPTAVLGGQTYSVIRVGTEHTCARGTTGGAYCWGRNDTGAVGDGATVVRLTPVGAVKP